MPFRFLDLPREIRDIIYSLALAPYPYDTENGVIDIQPSSPPGIGPVSIVIQSWGREEPLYAGTSLLRVSKQVHGEAAEILYAKNQFLIHYMSPSRFIKAIGPVNSSLLRNVQIGYQYVARSNKYGGKTHQAKLKAAKRQRQLMATSLSGLKSLEILVPFHASGLYGEQGRKVIDVDKGLGEIHRDLVCTLPKLERTVLVICGQRLDLDHADLRPIWSRIKELGWSFCRMNDLTWERDDNFDLEKVMEEGTV